MGTERSSDFYDQNLQNFLAPYEESVWKDIYDAVVELTPKNKDVRIIDVGCGTGRLAEALRRNDYLNYCGLDFSEKRIQEARRYLPGHSFFVLDALKLEAFKLIMTARVVVITEVLEHIARDLEVLRRVPPGCTVIASVPNFDSAAHVRHFEDIKQVVARYGGILRFEPDTVVTIERGDKVTFVFRAQRNRSLIAQIGFWARKSFFSFCGALRLIE